MTSVLHPFCQTVPTVTPSSDHSHELKGGLFRTSTVSASLNLHNDRAESDALYDLKTI